MLVKKPAKWSDTVFYTDNYMYVIFFLFMKFYSLIHNKRQPKVPVSPKPVPPEESTLSLGNLYSSLSQAGMVSCSGCRFCIQYYFWYLTVPSQIFHLVCYQAFLSQLFSLTPVTSNIFSQCFPLRST